MRNILLGLYCGASLVTTAPVFVNALSADALKNQQVNTLDELTLVAPSLQTGLGNNVSVESSKARYESTLFTATRTARTSTIQSTLRALHSTPRCVSIRMCRSLA